MQAGEVLSIVNALDDDDLERLARDCPEWRSDRPDETGLAWNRAVSTAIAALKRDGRQGEVETVWGEATTNRPQLRVADLPFAISGVYAPETLARATALTRLIQGALASDDLSPNDLSILGVDWAIERYRSLAGILG